MSDGLPAALDAAGSKGGQLRTILSDLIASLASGDALPSERALADRYGVARGTVRAEVDRLVLTGAVERVHGRGTFVAPPRVGQAGRYSSFTEDMRARGLVPGSRVLRQALAPVPADVAPALGLAPGAPGVVVERLRTAGRATDDDGAGTARRDGVDGARTARPDGACTAGVVGAGADGRRTAHVGAAQPMAIELAWLPAERFGALVDADLAAGSLIEALEHRWDVRIDRARQRAEAVVVDAREARLLGVGAGAPALRFTTVADDGTAPVYRATSLFRADRYEIEIVQHR